ncbi:histidine kinase [Nonomuraea sp. NPDC050547]|uniref:histidine kinase n=1 Tax=Nonomuraea sp. NPDC050547 TaxID=3364368 RepID=UPI0037AF21EC
MSALREADARLEEGRLQRERFVAQQQRVAAAREIHDIVAHSLTVVIVQADGAAYAAEHARPWDRGDAGKVLATIGRAARSALGEVRGVIDVLRDADEGPDQVHGAGLGVAELWQLVDSVRAAGLDVKTDQIRRRASPSPSTVTTARPSTPGPGLNQADRSTLYHDVMPSS